MPAGTRITCWTDVSGSKVRSMHMVRAAYDLVAIANDLRGRARRSPAQIR